VAEILGFDRTTAAENIRHMAPQAQLIQLSARSGEGMSEWYDFLNTRLSSLTEASPTAIPAS
jgi:hydrogenase nickel incorporation protein HypB